MRAWPGFRYHFDDDTCVRPRALSCDLFNKVVVLDVIVILLTVQAFLSTRFEQTGYRFLLDFLSFLFLTVDACPSETPLQWF